MASEVKPCPERSEGTLEIATGFALATTSSDCRVADAPRNDPLWIFEANYFVLPLITLDFAHWNDIKRFFFYP